MSTLTCLACGSSQLQKVSTYRAIVPRDARNKLKNWLIQHPSMLRFAPTPGLKKFRNFPFQGAVLRCKDCTLGQLEKMPSAEELEAFYASDYWPKREPDTDTKRFETCPRAKSQLLFLEQGLKQSSVENSGQTAAAGLEKVHSVLDIGAGSSTTPLLLRDKLKEQQEVRLSVIEPGTVWQDYYQALSVEVLGNFFPVETERKFSHIHTSHWLEHVTTPRETVDQLKGLLEPEGTIFIEVPYCDGDYWKLPIYDTPHTLFFSPESLTKLFEQAGFRTLKAGRYGISLEQWANDEWLSDEQYAQESEDGLWVRALFKLA